MKEKVQYKGRGGWRNGGRPRKDPALKQNIAKSFTLTPAEYEKFKIIVNKSGMKESYFIRRLVLKEIYKNE